MEKIGIFYGTTSGKTGAIVEEIEFNLKKESHEVKNVKDGIAEMNEFKNLILVTPSYGVGELQEDWENVYEEFKKIDFSEKIVGIVGLGNQFAFGETFVGGIKYLYDVVIANHGKVIGLTSIEGYQYQECDALVNDKFMGLALDESNQDDETPDRIFNWIKEIKKEFK